MPDNRVHSEQLCMIQSSCVSAYKIRLNTNLKNEKYNLSTF